MKISRNYITPFISLVFLTVGLSGLLMFFHLFDGFTEVLHECLGLFFMICAVFHIMLNWNGLKVHFKRDVFIPAALGVFTLSIVLISAEILNPPIDTVLINKLVRAPINDALKVLGITYDIASKKLRNNGISIEHARTIEDIWIYNHSDPETIIDIITE